MPWRLKGWLLLTSALAATALVAATAGAATDRADADRDAVFELIDPAAIGAGVCGRSDRHAATFKPMQLAMASPAEAVADDAADPPLWEGLGNLSYRITTDSDMAQRYFDQGLRLAYAFNHGEAYRAFKQAQALDPGCAMCFWGEAFVLGANINAGMEPAAVQPAFIALTNAKARAAGASAREQALIDALATRYSTVPGADPAALAGAYADAMAAAHAQFPEDQDIAVLFADALMNTSPWDYWELDGRTPKGRLGEAAAALEGVLAANPDHAGAIHMYIHLTEASATPEKAEPYADRLADLMPAAGHIVHMPAHTYYRVGRYLDSLTTNIKAVEADEAYLAQVAATGAYPYGYYPHNIHFVLVSAQMAGDAEHMLWAAERLNGKIPDDVAAEVGWIQIILPAPYFAHAQFSAPDVVLGLEDPGDTFPYVKAMWHYARGVAYATEGDLAAARAEAARIADINQSADFEMLLAWYVPAPDVLRLARHVLEGRIAQAEGNLERAIQEFEVAVQIQDSLPYLEPEYWYYPVRQSLGATLLMAGRPAEATEVFRAALLDKPNNGWALYGLMQAYDAAGDHPAKAAAEKLFGKAWAGAAPPDLARL
jgi:tetratricopeptide (TPR) repeat protein